MSGVADINPKSRVTLDQDAINMSGKTRGAQWRTQRITRGGEIAAEQSTLADFPACCNAYHLHPLAFICG